MAKCIRCGGSFLVHRKIKLKDAEICGKCFKELGFDKSYYLISSIYKYNDIKDGLDTYYKNKRKEDLKESILSDISIKVTGNGEERDLICTEEEREVFDIIRSLIDDNGFDSNRLKLVRKSDNYISAVMPSDGYGLMDVARIKYTNRAKWIKICPEFDIIPLANPEDVTKYEDEICNAYRFNEPYLDK